MTDSESARDPEKKKKDKSGLDKHSKKSEDFKAQISNKDTEQAKTLE